MTTHELARTLEIIAAALRSAPESHLTNVENVPSLLGIASPSPANLAAVARVPLAKLASYSKADLVSLMSENSIPIQVGQKDSASHVMRKLVRYLAENKNAKKKIRNKVAHGKTSPALSSALAYLLRESYE